MKIDELKAKIKKDNPYFENIDIKDYQVLDFLTFNEEKTNCKNCMGIDECKNSKKGFSPIIDKDNNISYVRCKYMEREIEIAKQSEKLNMMYLSKKLLEAKISNFRLDSDKRINCLKMVNNFIRKMDNNEYVKGAYISGDVGAGKSYFLAAVANELASRGYNVIFVYFPDLINDLKDDFDKLNKKINELKTTDILIIDDFGVGVMTSWVRDSIIAPILNYRMSDLKPVFMSSNIPFKDLDNYLKVKEDRDSTPAARIIRRIYELCDLLEM